MYLDVSDENLNTRGGNILVAVTVVLLGSLRRVVVVDWNI